MPEPRAQRTLVKSPPEIWSEVSDVSTLARHLGEFGEIRITRLEAETTVVWEGDTACGTVELEPSGWGTKVTIAAEAVAVEVEVEVDVEVEYEVEPEPEPVGQAPAPEPEPTPEPASTPAPRRGLFARLFGRGAKADRVTEPAPAPDPAPLAVPEPAAPVMATRIEKRVETRTEALEDERVEAVLVGVLDDLGAAHHRPFSRG